MEHMHIGEWVIFLIKSLHISFIAGIRVIGKDEMRNKKTFDFSGDDTIGDDIPYVFLG